MKTAALFWLGTLCSVALFSAPKKEEICDKALRHMRVTARYTTPQGVGYNHGYSTVEGFFAPHKFLGDAWLPFVDLRGHLFDNGKFAANAGVGCRYLSASRLWGVNFYYDYRNTPNQHYNQVAAGFETLGRVWDFRLNGYLPVGPKLSHFRNFRFDRFQGNNMFIRATQDFALKGANAEVGAHVDHFKKAPLYFAAGPYYLTGKGATTWGGELRAAVDLFSHFLRLEARTAYDHFFKWTGQGQISLNFSFGGKSQAPRRKGESCGKANTLHTRALQPVDRNEIIPTGRRHVLFNAINPATGLPFFFTFFNNTSHSLGTYESPYPILAAVDGDILYVFPGNGSAYDTSEGGILATGLQLNDSQMLLGASIPQPILTTLGVISIPAQAAALPLISTSNSGGNVVTLGNDNTISGFNIAGSGSTAISGSGITNFNSNQNLITGNGSTTLGILLAGALGQININSTTFISNYNCVSVTNSSTVTALNVAGSTFLQNNNNGVYLDSTSMIGTLTVTNSTFIGNQNGIEVDNSGIVGDLNVFDSVFESNRTGIYLNGEVSNTLNVAGNIFYYQVYNGFELTPSNFATYLNITGNSFYNNGSHDITLDNACEAIYVTIENNQFSQAPYNIIADLTNSSSCSIANNTFYQSGIYGISISSGGTGSCVLDIADNSFTALYSNPNPGFAASVVFYGSGSLCVEFVDNAANPGSNSSGGTAYLLSNSGSVFNVTESSQNSNIGQITYSNVTFTPQCGL